MYQTFLETGNVYEALVVTPYDPWYHLPTNSDDASRSQKKLSVVGR